MTPTEEGETPTLREWFCNCGLWGRSLTMATAEHAHRIGSPGCRLSPVWDESPAELTALRAVREAAERFLAENPKPTGAKANRRDYSTMVSCASLTRLHEAFAAALSSSGASPTDTGTANDND